MSNAPLPPMNGPSPPDLAADRRAYLAFVSLAYVALCLSAVIAASFVAGVFLSGAMSGATLDLERDTVFQLLPRGFIWLAFGFALALMILASAVFAVPRRVLLLHPMVPQILRGSAGFAPHRDPSGAIAYLKSLCPALTVRRVLVSRAVATQSGIIGRTLVLSSQDAARLDRQMAPPKGDGLLARTTRNQEASALLALVRHEAHHCQTGDAVLAIPLSGAVYVVSLAAALGVMGFATAAVSPILTVIVLLFALPASVVLAAWIFAAPLRRIEVWSELRADAYEVSLSGHPPPQVDAPRDSMLRRSYPTTAQRDAYLFGPMHGQTTTAFEAVSRLLLAVFTFFAIGNLLGNAGLLHPAMAALLVAGHVMSVTVCFIMGRALSRDISGLTPKTIARLAMQLSWPLLVLCLLEFSPKPGSYGLLLSAILCLAGLFAPALRAARRSGLPVSPPSPRPFLSEEFHAVARFTGLGFAVLLGAATVLPSIDPRGVSFGPWFVAVFLGLALLAAATFVHPRSRIALLLEAIPTLIGSIMIASVIPVYGAVAASTACAASAEPLICVGDQLMTTNGAAVWAARTEITKDPTLLIIALVLLVLFWGANGLILRKRWLYLGARTRGGRFEPDAATTARSDLACGVDHG